MKKIETEKIPIYIFAQVIEEGALEQGKNLANLPFAFHHIAIMPDVHEGYGMPIGGILATENVVVPNAVGVDIGCGMNAVRTSLTKINVNDLKKILGKLRTLIPVGFSHHEHPQSEEFMPKLEIPEVAAKEYKSALTQIGTLGGGNHFIEIQKGDDGHIWLMVHSGSRNIGLKVATSYNKLAVSLKDKWNYDYVVPTPWQLDYLPIDSKEGQNYLNEMNFCMEFARSNRSLMMNKIKETMAEFFPKITFEDEINIHHNYAHLEEHFGKKVMVHRKGATSAIKGQLGIIPGSQGTRSYIVRGLGNPDSFMSCSHGAGRVLSRKQARKILSLETEKRKLNEKGILHGIRGARDLDEASSAYKDIDMVMEEQKDLVVKVVSLEPLAVLKG